MIISQKKALTGLFAGSFIAGITLLAYKAFNVKNAVGDFDYELLSVRFKEESNWTDYVFNGIDFIVDIKIINNRNTKILFNELNLSLFNQDSEIADIVLREELYIKAMSSTILSPIVNISLTALPLNVLKIVKTLFTKGSEKQISVEGYIIIEGISNDISENINLIPSNV